MAMESNPQNPHLALPVLWREAAVGDGKDAVMVLVHGRGQSPDDMFDFAGRLRMSSVQTVALEAANHTWYPSGFMAPREDNEPFLTYALEAYHAHMLGILSHGIPKRRIVLVGFSQGACLTAQYAVTHPDCYGGIVLLTGGVIGPEDTSWDFDGSFDGTPVFLGTSDVDSWVPESRVRETEALFRRMGAETTLRIYPGMGHLISDDEVVMTRTIVARALENS